jgi:hypothetical protein
MEFKNRNKFILLFHPLPSPAEPVPIHREDIAIYNLSYSCLSLLRFRLSEKYILKLTTMVKKTTPSKGEYRLNLLQKHPGIIIGYGPEIVFTQVSPQFKTKPAFC